MSESTLDIELTWQPSSSASREVRKVRFAMESVGASTREGVRLIGRLAEGGSWGGGLTMTVLVCRTLPDTLRIGVFYCPLIAQKNDRIRSLAESLLLPVLEEKKKEDISDSSDEEEDPEEIERRRVKALAARLKRFPGELARLPPLGKPDASDQAVNDVKKSPELLYPQLSRFLARARKLQAETAGNDSKGVFVQVRLQELLECDAILDQFEAATKEIGLVDSFEISLQAEKTLRDRFSRKFLKSFPVFREAVRLRKRMQKEFTVAAVSSGPVGQWFRFIEGVMQGVGVRRGEVLGGIPGTSQFQDGMTPTCGGASWLSVDEEGRFGVSSYGIMSEESTDTSKELMTFPSHTPVSLVLLFFLTRLPSPVILKNPAFPLLAALLPDLSLPLEDARMLLEGPGMDPRGFLSRKDLTLLVSRIIYRLSEIQAGAGVLSPEACLRLLRTFKKSGKISQNQDSSLIDKLSVSTFALRASSCKTETNLKALALEAAEKGYVFPEIRLVHIRLSRLQDWRFKALSVLDTCSVGDWLHDGHRDAYIEDLVLFALNKAEISCLSTLITAPKVSRAGTEFARLKRVLCELRWAIEVVVVLRNDRAAPSLTYAQSLLARAPASLKRWPFQKYLLEQVTNCNTTLTQQGGDKFISEQALAEYGNLEIVAGFNVHDEPLVRNAREVQQMISSWRAGQGEVGTSLAAEIDQNFDQVDKAVTLTTDERRNWKMLVLKERVRRLLLDCSVRDLDALSSVISEWDAEYGSRLLDENLITAKELINRASTLLAESINGNEDCWSELSSMRVTSAAISTFSDIKDEWQSVTSRLHSILKRDGNRIGCDMMEVDSDVPTLPEIFELSDRCGRLLQVWSNNSMLTTACNDLTDLKRRAVGLDSRIAVIQTDIGKTSFSEAESVSMECENLYRSPLTDWLKELINCHKKAEEHIRLCLTEPGQSLRELLRLAALLRKAGFAPDPIVSKDLNNRLWSGLVRFLAGWAAWKGDKGGRGVPWLLLVQTKAASPPEGFSDPDAQLWLTSALAAADRILKECKPLQTDAIGTPVPERLGKWARLRLLLPAYPIALYEPMEQLRTVLESRFSGFRLSCGYLENGKRRLESTLVALPGGRPGIKVSVKPGRSLAEPNESEKLSSTFKKRMEGGAGAGVEVSKVVKRALKLATEIPGLIEYLEDGSRTVQTWEDVAEKGFGKHITRRGSAERLMGFSEAAIDALKVALGSDEDEARRVEEAMRSEIPSVSPEDPPKYAERLLKTLLHIQQVGNADRLLVKRSSAVGGLEALIPSERPSSTSGSATPLPLPPPGSFARQADSDRPLWNGPIEGVLKGEPFHIFITLLALFEGAPIPADCFKDTISLQMEGSMSATKLGAHVSKVESSGKRSLLDVLVLADWARSADSVGSLLATISNSGSQPHAVALVGTSAMGKVKLWLIPPETTGALRGYLEIPSTNPVVRLKDHRIQERLWTLDAALRESRISGVSFKSVYSDELRSVSPPPPAAMAWSEEVTTQSPLQENAVQSVAALEVFEPQPAEKQGGSMAVDILLQLHRELNKARSATPPTSEPSLTEPNQYELPGSSFRDALRSGRLEESNRMSFQQIQAPLQDYQPGFQSFQSGTYQNTGTGYQSAGTGYQSGSGYQSMPFQDRFQPSGDPRSSQGFRAGPAPCRFFNQGHCTKADCRFPHVCSVCRGGHSAAEHERYSGAEAREMQWR